MKLTQINAKIVADSISPKGNRLTSLLITFPRFILAEVNTHRMLSKNTSSSRAIPFSKMVESINNDPFIPIAWQKPHKGMQGTEYYDHTLTEEIGGLDYTNLPRRWLRARDTAVSMAKIMADERGNMPVTKQLCNRLLEPFMWTTMLITGSKEGWDNFFELRCPRYEISLTPDDSHVVIGKSWREVMEWEKDGMSARDLDTDSIVERLQYNKGGAEIHMSLLAETIYDAMNESKPRELKPGQWHIPFGDTFDVAELSDSLMHSQNYEWSATTAYKDDIYSNVYLAECAVAVSTALAARVSYTTIDSKDTEHTSENYIKLLSLHDRLIAQDPPHSSPMEHCARAMSDEEYFLFRKGKGEVDYSLGISSSNPVVTHGKKDYGWCRNYRGFIQYRHLIENETV